MPLAGVGFFFYLCPMFEKDLIQERNAQIQALADTLARTKTVYDLWQNLYEELDYFIESYRE